MMRDKRGILIVYNVSVTKYVNVSRKDGMLRDLLWAVAWNSSEAIKTMFVSLC